MNLISFSSKSMHHTGFAPYARFARIAALCVLALVAVGCSHNKFNYGVNERFSMNISPAPPWFANPKAPLAPAEKEVLSRRGAPDFVRYWWRPDGSLVTGSDFAGRRDDFKDLINASRKSWIYLKEDKAEEVIFIRGGASYQVRPLAEPMKLICQYGDPSSRVQPGVIDGERHETWTWVDNGIQIEMVEGKVKNTKNFQGTGSGTILIR